MVQDLRTLSEATEDIHLVVPNPYTPLATLPSTRTWYSVSDFKNAFFWASLVAQWLGVRLPMQGTGVQALVREVPTRCGAMKPVRHNC